VGSQGKEGVETAISVYQIFFKHRRPVERQKKYTDMNNVEKSCNVSKICKHCAKVPRPHYPDEVNKKPMKESCKILSPSTYI
jgi:hypothetical protein